MDYNSRVIKSQALIPHLSRRNAAWVQIPKRTYFRASWKQRRRLRKRVSSFIGFELFVNPLLEERVHENVAVRSFGALIPARIEILFQ